MNPRCVVCDRLATVEFTRPEARLNLLVAVRCDEHLLAAPWIGRELSQAKHVRLAETQAALASPFRLFT